MITHYSPFYHHGSRKMEANKTSYLSNISYFPLPWLLEKGYVSYCERGFWQPKGWQIGGSFYLKKTCFLHPYKSSIATPFQIIHLYSSIFISWGGFLMEKRNPSVEQGSLYCQPKHCTLFRRNPLRLPSICIASSPQNRWHLMTPD